MVVLPDLAEYHLWFCRHQRVQNLEVFVSDKLAREGSCFVSEEELRRVWPDDLERKYQIVRFAQERNWSVLSYTAGRGAILYRRQDSSLGQ